MLRLPQTQIMQSQIMQTGEGGLQVDAFTATRACTEYIRYITTSQGGTTETKQESPAKLA